MAPLTDYIEIISMVQKGLVKIFEHDESVLNVPGKSIALKVDLNYYLALYPSFFEVVCKKCGILPKTLLESLIKTGNLIVDPVTKDYYRLIEVRWKSDMTPIKINAGFLVSSFVDNSFKLYGRKIKTPLPISNLKISRKYKSNIDPLFSNKTPLNLSAFFD